MTMKTHRQHASEAEAHDYLLSLCRPDGAPLCPRCGCRRIYTLSGSRMRCAECKYTFHEFSGRWLDNGALSCSQWLELLRCFAEEQSVDSITERLGLSCNTVYKALTVVRFSILAHAQDAAQLLGPQTGLDSFLNGSRLTGGPTRMRMETIPVYGILTKDDWAFIDLVPGLRAETVFHFHLNFQLKLERLGNLIYSERYRHYDALILCGNNALPYDCIRRHRTPVHIDVMDSGFWAFARHRIKRFRGISCQRFPLYLKELEFRFNNREQDIFPLLTRRICGLVRPC
ncbi:transposase [Salidesulfovibrio onnuriiensis]|uniref:transposase n=1 Tax=Salidesulfovibrio onnuriiensis TaxID=2583823 RepID=UPI0011C9AB1A|nr:transposase [Salidesulfovibrio onnuriiensis]